MNYEELVKALRCCATVDCGSCPYYVPYGFRCATKMVNDAAAAIEALQAEVKRLKEGNEELREKQTFIDHYGAEWITSAKDVPTAAYKHGYADGRAEVKAQLPKRGEWKPFDLTWGRSIYSCTVCGEAADVPTANGKVLYNFCPSCGAKMEEEC